MSTAHERARLALPAGTTSPFALARRLVGRPGLVVLDGDGSVPRGRFSFVASDPVEVVRAGPADDAFEVLARVAGDGGSSRLPRWIGFVAYDAARPAIDSPRHATDDAPTLWFGRYDALAVFDAANGQAELVADDEAALERMRARLGLVTDVPDVPSAAGQALASAHVGPLAVDDADAHARAIVVALEAIVRGDVYQVNLARRFRAAFSGEALRLYEAMAAASPVPFGAFLRTDGPTVLGRSMECFLSFDAASRRLLTRPIKGTVPESDDRAADARALRGDPKEHAEHVMVVDLLRNDLGRVATIGTVRVDEALVVEPFARLSHLVSTVTCELAEGHTLASVMRETFPPGSVTGTPKRAAMRLIEALETHARGVYCGAYGYVAHDGSFELAVAIRTATIADGVLDYHAGGGIVVGSEPSREVAETELKARVLRDALLALGDGR